MPDKPKTADTLSQLAEGVEVNPHFQSIQEWLGGRGVGEVFSPSAIGFTKKVAEGVIFKAFKEHPRGKALVKELDDLLKVVRKTPKKATEHIKEFSLEPGFNTIGYYTPERLTIAPIAEEAGSMAHSFAHEVAHGATMPMAGRVSSRHRGIPRAARQSLVGTPESIGMDLYQVDKYRGPFEGVAEYIGHHLQRQAGLEPAQYFGHGPEQQAVFEELAKMPSKNPFMNVYRFFQKVMK